MHAAMMSMITDCESATSASPNAAMSCAVTLESRGPIRSVNRPVAGAVIAPTAVFSEPMRPSSNRLRLNSSMKVLASTDTMKIRYAVDTMVDTSTKFRNGFRLAGSASSLPDVAASTPCVMR